MNYAIALFAVTAASSALAAGETPRILDPALARALGAGLPDAGEVRVFDAEYDLDGDGRPETLAYLAGRTVCGTGGCPLQILARDGTAYRRVAEMTVVRLPVRVAASASHGWRDLIVGIGGGGLPAGNARLRNDGTAYPSNPTVPPAEPVADPADATVLIPEFDMYTEGKPLSGNEVRQ